MVKSMGKAVLRNGQRREPLLHGNLCTYAQSIRTNHGEIAVVRIIGRSFTGYVANDVGLAMEIPGHLKDLFYT